MGKAIELYQKGKTFREIGERLGISASTARRWIKKNPLRPEIIGAPPGYIEITKIRKLEADEAREFKAAEEVVSVAGRPGRVGFVERVLRALRFG